MKNLIMPFVLTSALVILQGCSPKAEEAENKKIETITDTKAEATFVKAKNEEIAARRAEIEKARAGKEEERRLAAAAKASLTYKDSSGRTVYYKAEVDPTYTGGMEELRNYLKDNLKYPENARQKGYEGTVFVDFVVNANGKIREVVATDVIGENVDSSFKDEAVRVVSGMSGWNAGRQHGKPVDTSFSIPITFQLEN